MKKIAIVLFVAASALAGCGKKKAPEAPAQPATEEPAAPAEGEGSDAPATEGEGGEGM